MSMNQSATTGAGHDGLSVAGAFRQVLRCGVIFVDCQTRTAKVSEEASQMLGLMQEQNAGLVAESLPRPLASLVQEAFSSRTPVASRPIKLHSEAGSLSELHASVLFIEPGRPESGLVVVLNDLTAAERLGQHLGRLDRLALLGTLSAGMAHEIKNALVAGKTFVDLLLERHQDAELVEVVRRELSRIDTILSRMLKFAGPSPPTFSETRVHEVLDYSLRLVQPQIARKDVLVTRLFQAETDQVRGDDSQLQQALVNLLLNALEAVSEAGTLSVATQVISSQVDPERRSTPSAVRHLLVTVQDDGVGISPEHLNRVFEPFFTTKPNGTGLGLLITRQIIEDHGGHLAVESVLGQGTTFRITLPVLESAP